ncbi:MAG: leucine-rich repeat protein [Clostridia bacterium]|nr:leucine-rich repeat protein [Clostridia bacterium]
MEISLNCPNCGREIIVENENASDIRLCPYCGKPWKKNENQKGKIGVEGGGRTEEAETQSDGSAEKTPSQKKRPHAALFIVLAAIAVWAAAGAFGVFALSDSKGNDKTPPLTEQPTGKEEFELDAATLEASLVYSAVGDEVWITGHKAGYDFGNFTIPSVINGRVVTTIGSGAFENCESLTGVTFFGNITAIGDKAFADCAALAAVELNAELETIGAHAFARCGNLTEISLPNRLKTIENSAFAKSGLTAVEIPASVTSIGSEAFRECYALTGFQVESNTRYTAIDGNLYYSYEVLSLIQYAIGKTEESFSLPDNVCMMDVCALYGCKLTEITFPKSMVFLSADDFWGCESLTGVQIADENERFTAIDGNLYSKDQKTLIAYMPAKTESNFNIPDGVTAIAQDAFADHKYLQKAFIPESVTSIGYNAFGIMESALEAVSFGGDQTTWESVQIGENNQNLLELSISYSATKFY